MEPAWSAASLRHLDLSDEESDDEAKGASREGSPAAASPTTAVDHSEDDDFDDDLFCVACDKSFKSAKSYENHERSRKHKENVEILKNLMKEEDKEVFSDKSQLKEDEVEGNGEGVDSSGEESTEASKLQSSK